MRVVTNFYRVVFIFRIHSLYSPADYSTFHVTLHSYFNQISLKAREEPHATWGREYFYCLCFLFIPHLNLL